MNQNYIELLIVFSGAMAEGFGGLSRHTTTSCVLQNFGFAKLAENPEMVHF